MGRRDSNCLCRAIGRVPQAELALAAIITVSTGAGLLVGGIKRIKDGDRGDIWNTDAQIAVAAEQYGGVVNTWRHASDAAINKGLTMLSPFTPLNVTVQTVVKSSSGRGDAVTTALLESSYIVDAPLASPHFVLPYSADIANNNFVAYPTDAQVDSDVIITLNTSSSSTPSPPLLQRYSSTL